MMRTQEWTVAEAKAEFSKVIEQAVSNGPQAITRRGRKTAVVVGAEEWERKTKRQGNLAEFFAASPLRGARLKMRRLPSHLRKASL
jgi:prevent-host-death family protein